MDLIGKIFPPSSKGHHYIIVATNVFTKLVEAIPMKVMIQQDIIKVIKENIVHRFNTLLLIEGQCSLGIMLKSLLVNMVLSLLIQLLSIPKATAKLNQLIEFLKES